jgi:hypothetical protein
MREKLPDWLTASRGLIGLAIVGLIPAGPRSLRSVVWLLLLGWTTDVLDGRLAHRVEKGSTWVGEHDFHFDMGMVLASAVYLVATGLVPRRVGVPYLAAAVPLSLLAEGKARHFLRFKSLTMLLACPWVFAPFILAYQHERSAAYVALAWTAVALLFDWRRFAGVVGDFLAGARTYLRRS